MICRNIKNIRFSSFQPLKERYGDWLISGDWPNGIQAHNIATNENTGILSYKDRPTGNMSWLDESHRTYAAFNERYRNYIHVVAKNSSQNYDFLRRFNLDDSSFTDFDLTQYDYEFNSYKVYKDLVLFDVVGLALLVRATFSGLLVRMILSTFPLPERRWVTELGLFFFLGADEPLEADLLTS